MSISHRIAQGRIALGLTTQELASRCGVSRGAVQHWEAGLTAPSRRNQERVAQVLGLTVAQLMSGLSIDASIEDEQLALSASLECLAKLIQKAPSDKTEAIVALVSAMIRSPSDHETIASSITPLLKRKTLKSNT